MLPGEKLLELVGHESPVSNVEFSLDGRTLIGAGDDGLVSSRMESAEIKAMVSSIL
jgi:hypothetical protein